MTNTQTDYRTRIYESYVSNFQDSSQAFDADVAWQWGRAQRYYLREWLVTRRTHAT